MKLNPLSGRWEVWWMDTKGEPFLFAWISGEVPEEQRSWWYRNVVLKRLGL